MMAILLGSAMSCVPIPSCVDGGEQPERPRVGRIIIEGNVHTLDRDILEELNINPGEILPSESDLLRAEMRLLMAFHKRFDLADRQRPRIELKQNELDKYILDMRIRFPEKGKKKP